MRVELKNAKVGIYSAKIGAIPNSTYIIDVSNFRDPMGQKEFRKLDGRDEKVKEWINSDRRVPALIDAVAQVAIDAAKNAGVNYLSICLYDHHGKWIAPALAEIVADKLAEHVDVAVRHTTLT